MAYREEGTVTLKMLAQDLASGKVGAFIGHLDKLAQKGGLVGSVAQGVGQSFGQLLNPMGLVSSGLGMVTDFAGKAIAAASDLSESLSKSQVVFGDNAAAIEDWANTSSRSVGLSKQAALEAAGTFGNLFDALKLADDAQVEMSKGAIQLAADLASFNNANLDETLAAIQSGLLGEAEPMRRFGSNLSAARVEAYALAQGWVKNKAALTDAMKVQARYALILEDTTNAQGDFGRTSDGLANSQRILNAELENLTAEIGTELQPVMRDFAVFAKDTLVPAIRDVIGLVKELGSYSEELGTLFNIMSLNFGAQNAAIEDYFASLDPWVRTFHDLGEELGYTRVQLFRLSQEFHRGNKSVVEFGEYLGSLRKPKATDILPAPGDVEETVNVIPTATKKAVKQTERSLASLVDISRTTLKDTRKEVRDRMRDINDALEHPFRDQKLEKTYQTAIRQATKRMNKALREGNEEAYAEASQFVEEYKAKLRELRLQRFRVRVSMFVDDSGVTGPGATLLGGLAGGAWGSRPARRAGGGPVSANQAYIVGEDRPEVFVPNTGGTIVPSTKGLGSTFVYAPGYSTASPAEAQRFMAAIGPEMERYWQRRL